MKKFTFPTYHRSLHFDKLRFEKSKIILDNSFVDKIVPSYIKRPSYSCFPFKTPTQRSLVIKSFDDIRDKLRPSCKIAAETLEYAKSLVKPGIATGEIDRKCHEFIVKNGAYPSPLTYEKFPKSICVSVNNVICHGIPDDELELIEGDIVSIDVTVFRDGYHGDTCGTFQVGQISQDMADLLKHSKTSLLLAIESLGPGVPLSLVGETIEEYATLKNLNVIPEICGHGIGEAFHELPFVYHCAFEEDDSMELVPGMCFTIEPALTTGSGKFKTWPDGWTIVTADGEPAAQFEHTIAITDKGAEILTMLN